MMYLTTTLGTFPLHISGKLPIHTAIETLTLQADGDELDLILERIPSLDTGERVQKFYGADAVKAALSFCFQY